MQELSEVITVARFHPQRCHIMVYGTSQGAINVCDLRQAAVVQDYSAQSSFAHHSDVEIYDHRRINRAVTTLGNPYRTSPSTRNHFAEIVSSTADIRWTSPWEWLIMSFILCWYVAVLMCFYRQFFTKWVSFDWQRLFDHKDLGLTDERGANYNYQH